LLLPLSSFSNYYTFGYTGNAAYLGLNWTMTTPILGISTEEGMDISGVIYNYLPVKEVEDDFTVTVQNENVDGGYIFQDTEDWSGGPGIRIQKLISLPYTPISQFGEGSITTTGTGTVEDATVLYMYRWDECFNPQNNENCPGYVPPMPVMPVIEIYDVLEDEIVDDATKETDKELIEEKKEEKNNDEEEEEEKRLEIALAASGNALTIANTASQASVVRAMNIATNITSYYVTQIQGGSYGESVSLQGGTIVDNKRALRSLGQDKLMNAMIEEQYQ
jgi:hypothetical protein